MTDVLWIADAADAAAVIAADVTVVVAAAGAGAASAGAVTNRRLSSQTWQKLIFCWKKMVDVEHETKRIKDLLPPF